MGSFLIAHLQGGVNMNPADVARLWVGISRYDFLEEHCYPPEVVNCYTLVAWAYGQCEIWIPQTLLGQLYAGTLAVGDYAQGTCLVFTKGNWGKGGYFDSQRAVKGVGHVGIVSSQGTVIHTSSSARTVVEEPLERFLGDRSMFRGIYRIR